MTDRSDVDTKKLFSPSAESRHSPEILWKGTYTSLEDARARSGEMEIWLPADLNLSRVQRKGLTMRHRQPLPLFRDRVLNLTLEKDTAADNETWDDSVVFRGEHGSTKFMFKCVGFTEKSIQGIYCTQNPDDQGTFEMFRDCDAANAAGDYRCIIL